MASILQYIQRFIALHFLAKCCNSKNAVKFMIAKVDHFGRQKLKCISMLFKCMVLEFTNGASFQNFRTSFSKMIVRDFSFSVSEAIMYIHIKTPNLSFCIVFCLYSGFYSLGRSDKVITYT